MASDALTPGDHVFDTTNNSPVAKLSYTVIPSKKASAPLMIIQTVGWGPGRTYSTRSIAPLFTDHFTVLTFSTRGSDESSKPKDADGNDDPMKMSTAMMADDLESLRIYLNIPTFPVLMGHSHASAISLAYGENYPDHVEKLVLIGGQLVGYDGSATFKRFAEERAPKPQWAAAYKAWEAGIPKTDEDFQTFLMNILPSYFVDPEKDCPGFAAQIEGSPLRIWNFYSQNAADDAELGGKKITKAEEIPEDEREAPLKMVRGLSRVKANTLVSHGREDMICAIECAQMTVDMINAAGGKAEIDVFENCGHFPWVEKKEAFLKNTFRFLEV